MSLKSQMINDIYNQLFAGFPITVEFDTKEDYDYVKKELTKKVVQIEAQLNELQDEEAEETRLSVEFINLNTAYAWNKDFPRTVKFTLKSKEEMIKSYGFRVISSQ